jgi:hypothetical protein
MVPTNIGQLATGADKPIQHRRKLRQRRDDPVAQS